jgi:hypothetical protein
LCSCKFVVLRERKKQLYSIDEAANLNFLSTQEQLKVYEKIELFHEQFGLIKFLVFVGVFWGEGVGLFVLGGVLFFFYFPVSIAKHCSAVFAILKFWTTQNST